MKTIIADFIAHVDSGRHHLALEQARLNPRIFKSAEVNKAINTAYIAYHKRWPAEATDELRREFRAFAKLYNEVRSVTRSPMASILLYPDRTDIIWSVSNLRANPSAYKYGESFSDDEIAEHYEALIGPRGSRSRVMMLKTLKGTDFDEHAYGKTTRREKVAQVQESAIVICFTGKQAKVHAKDIAIALASEHDLQSHLIELGLTLKFVRVHDCQRHPLK